MNTLMIIAAILLIGWNVLVTGALLSLLDGMREGEYCRDVCPYRKRLDR